MDATYKAFTSHRASAEARGIPFRFTFAEWWSVWAPHWARRHLDNLCMCRKGDTGDYAVGNVYIATSAQNLAHLAENIREASKLRFVPTQDRSIKDQLRVAELDSLLDAMRATGCNLTASAKILGITFRQARYLMHKNGLKKSDVAMLL